MVAKKAVPRQKSGVPILERTLGLLEFLSRCPQGVALSQIARTLKIPKNTTYRMLNTLCTHGYVSRNEAELSYRLTRKLATLVYTSAQEGGLIERALAPMRELRDRVKETVVISILDHQEGIVLEQVPGLHPFRFVCDPGTRQPLHASASTKAILCQLTPGELLSELEHVTYTRYTERTITTAAAFRRELAETRARGYGLDRGEALHGVVCVAAAVLDRQRHPVAAITVTGPAERIRQEDFDKIGGWVVSCSQAVSRSIA
jgi:IclR family acetate operon transcriptional repressor